MGCSTSKLDDEEAVRLCRDRKNFIKEAIEQRNRFASGHAAYIQSLRLVSLALCNYVDEGAHHGFFLDSYTTPPLTHVKRLSHEVISSPLKSFTLTSTKPGKSTSFVVNYLRSGEIPTVPIEEMPGSPEIMRIESYHPMDHYGIDGSFTTDAPPVNTSFFSSPYDRPSYPPASPQTSQWDFFWNPSLLMDTYGYPLNSLDQVIDDDEITRLRMVREKGIPELEEEEDRNNKDHEEFMKVEVVKKAKVVAEHTADEVCKDTNKDGHETKKVNEVKELQSQGGHSMEVSESRNAVELEVNKEQRVARNRESIQETPGFTVYVDRRPTSTAEVMKDVESQFLRICDFANEVSVMLEASRTQNSSNSLAVRMLNPASLFHSSLSSSSRFLQGSSTSRDDGNENGSNHSEESFIISGSHKSTLDRLYAWEKKLYEEVKTEELLRIAYEKKCMQLRSHDLNGAEPSVVHKTRAAMRDLQTQLGVSINSMEYVSKRIETLRDEELYPQLVELIQGIARMWSAMAECHRIQKRTIDEAKLLLFSSSPAAVPTGALPPSPSRSAARLEAELRNWRSRLAAWIEAQRAYARALAGWILRCAPAQRDTDDHSMQGSPLSGGGGGGGAPPVYGVCVRWSRLLDAISEVGAIDGVDFFAAGVGSVAGQRGEGAAAKEEGAGMMTAEVGERVLCAGMSVAAGALADFAGESAEGYEALVRAWEEGGRERPVDS